MNKFHMYELAQKIEDNLDSYDYLDSIYKTLVEYFNLDKEPFDVEAFKERKFAVHCPKKEQAKEFLLFLDSIGIGWSGFKGKSNKHETNWEKYKSLTFYIYEEGVGVASAGIKYGNVLQRQGLTLFVNYSDLDFKNIKTKEKENGRKKG